MQLLHCSPARLSTQVLTACCCHCLHARPAAMPATNRCCLRALSRLPLHITHLTAKEIGRWRAAHTLHDMRQHL